MQLFCVVFIILTSQVFPGMSIVSGNLFVRKNPAIGIFNLNGHKLRVPNNEKVYKVPGNNKPYVSPQLFSNYNVLYTLLLRRLPCPVKIKEGNHITKVLPVVRKFSTGRNIPISYTIPTQIERNILPFRLKKLVTIQYQSIIRKAYNDDSIYETREKQSDPQSSIYIKNRNDEKNIEHKPFVLKPFNRKMESVTSRPYRDRNIQNNTVHHSQLMETIDKRDSKRSEGSPNGASFLILPQLDGKFISDKILNTKDGSATYDSQKTEVILEHLTDKNIFDNRINRSIAMEEDYKKEFVPRRLEINKIKGNINVSLDEPNLNLNESDSYITEIDRENQFIISQKDEKEVIEESTIIIKENELNIDGAVNNQEIFILDDVPTYMPDIMSYPTNGSVDKNDQDDTEMFERNTTETSTESFRGDIPIFLYK